MGKGQTPENMSDDEDMMMGGGMIQSFLDGRAVKEFEAKPKKIRERAELLMMYHEEYLKLQREMEKKEMALRQKYDNLYEPLYARRREILTGTGTPVSEEEVAKGFPEEHKGVVETTGTVDPMDKNIPNFWLSALQHHVGLASIIEEYDEEVLHHLIDINSTIVEGGYGSFSVVFTFEPNLFFEEEKLTITLLVGENSEDIEVKRSPITWKSGKNPAITTAAPKKKGARAAAPRKVTRPSFFDIFTKKSSSDDEEDGDDDSQVIALLQVVHNSIVPCAVNYYTGEARDGSSDMEEDDYEEDDDDDEDY